MLENTWEKTVIRERKPLRQAFNSISNLWKEHTYITNRNMCRRGCILPSCLCFMHILSCNSNKCTLFIIANSSLSTRRNRRGESLCSNSNVNPCCSCDTRMLSPAPPPSLCLIKYKCVNQQLWEQWHRSNNKKVIFYWNNLQRNVWTLFIHFMNVWKLLLNYYLVCLSISGIYNQCKGPITNDS